MVAPNFSKVYFIFATSGGETGAGTLLLIAGSSCRYANIAFKSSSVYCAIDGHGIAGNMGLPPSWPRCLPVRMVFINTSSVHAPRPVAESGVRLAE